MNTLTTEQIREILAGAPDGATHYCKRNRQYYKRDGNSDRLLVWLRGTEEWSVPVEDKTRWLDRLPNLREILELRDRVAELDSQRQWISVDDRMPCDSVNKVYAFNENSRLVPNDHWISVKDNGQSWNEDDWIVDDGVTHWMYMPKPPKETR